MVQHCHARGKRGEIIDEFVTTVLASVEMSDVLDRTAQLLRKHYGRTRVGITLVVRDDPTLAEVLMVDDPTAEDTPAGQRFAVAGMYRNRAGDALGSEMVHQAKKKRQLFRRYPLLIERQDIAAAVGLQQVVGILDPLGDALA